MQKHLKSDEKVLQFIYDFRGMQHSPDIENILYLQFACGYCYYFAHMLKTAFKRGEVCWAAPFGHIVWMDDNGVPYDISGVNESETNDYIPEYMMGETIYDFTHTGNSHCTTDQEIAQMILDWQDVKVKLLADVTCFTKNDAVEFIERDFHSENDEEQRIYNNQCKYLTNKFSLNHPEA